jgi:hypothetical protein
MALILNRQKCPKKQKRQQGCWRHSEIIVPDQKYTLRVTSCQLRKTATQNADISCVNDM